MLLTSYQTHSYTNMENNNRIGEEESFEWKPPTLTEAEKMEIQAKQKERDQLSSAMGKYLLKGYRMLDSNCSDCGNILLRTPGGNSNYCISCEELGNPSTGKNQPPPQESVEIEEVASTSVDLKVKSQDLSLAGTEHALTHKIQWATTELAQSTSVDYSTQLCVLIQEALKALGKLKQF